MFGHLVFGLSEWAGFCNEHKEKTTNTINDSNGLCKIADACNLTCEFCACWFYCALENRFHCPNPSQSSTPPETRPARMRLPFARWRLLRYELLSNWHSTMCLPLMVLPQLVVAVAYIRRCCHRTATKKTHNQFEEVKI